MNKEYKKYLINELEKHELILKYNYSKKEYYIYKKGNILEKLYMDFEINDINEIVKEFNKMISSFKDQQYFIDNILYKKIKDMSIKEFRRVSEHGGNKEVNSIINKYFDSLEPKEKRRIRNEHDDIRDYVFYKYIENLQNKGA